MKWDRRLPKRSRRQLLSSEFCDPNTLCTRDHTSSERVQSRSEYCRDGASARFSTGGAYCISIEKLNSRLHSKTVVRTLSISELLPPSFFHKPGRGLLSVWTSTWESRILALNASKAQNKALASRKFMLPDSPRQRSRASILPLCDNNTPLQARLETSQYKETAMCFSDLHGKQPAQSSTNRQYANSDRRRPVTLVATFELRAR